MKNEGVSGGGGEWDPGGEWVVILRNEMTHLPSLHVCTWIMSLLCFCFAVKLIIIIIIIIFSNSHLIEWLLSLLKLFLVSPLVSPIFWTLSVAFSTYGCGLFRQKTQKVVFFTLLNQPFHCNNIFFSFLYSLIASMSVGPLPLITDCANNATTLIAISNIFRYFI